MVTNPPQSDSGPSPRTSTSKPLTTTARTILIAGPTAVGKSAVALELARRIGGEIISVDSMQVYRGMDIGTAKPSLKEQTEVRHHLVDVADPTTPFDAARFASLAHEAIEDIRRRGKVPILCGGTGLYFKAFLDGIGTGPAPDAVLRSELEKSPYDEILLELQRRDPETYHRIDRKNPRRVIRALEVIRLTGKPAAAARSTWTRGDAGRDAFFGLHRSPEDLHQRIESRVDRMFAQGLVEEVARLRQAGLEQNRTAMQAIGYRQVMEHLQGVRSLPDTITLIKQRTRQFARRQFTWFRGQFDLEWIDVTGRNDSGNVAGSLLASAEKLGL